MEDLKAIKEGNIRNYEKASKVMEICRYLGARISGALASVANLIITEIIHNDSERFGQTIVRELLISNINRWFFLNIGSIHVLSS